VDRKIVDYKVVNLFYDPADSMKRFIDIGYQPYGYPVIHESNYMQAMVKYED